MLFLSPDHGIIGATCEVTDPTYTGLKCAANNRLFLPRNVKVKVYYDISSSNLLPDNDLDRMKEFIKVRKYSKDPVIRPPMVLVEGGNNSEQVSLMTSIYVAPCILVQKQVVLIVSVVFIVSGLTVELYCA